MSTDIGIPELRYWLIGNGGVEDQSTVWRLAAPRVETRSLALSITNSTFAESDSNRRDINAIKLRVLVGMISVELLFQAMPSFSSSSCLKISSSSSALTGWYLGGRSMAPDALADLGRQQHLPSKKGACPVKPYHVCLLSMWLSTRAMFALGSMDQS